MVKKFTVKKLLQDIQGNKIDEALYWLMIPTEEVNWSEDTPCMLATDEECEECEGEYGEIDHNATLSIKYIVTINVDTIREILGNLGQQIKEPTMEQELDALIFYINNDAFIEIESSKI